MSFWKYIVEEVLGFKRKVNNPQKKQIKKEIKFYSFKEVGKIIKPKINKQSVTFYDLSGVRVSKIPPSKRDICIEYNCYLGLKKFKNSERWVPIKVEEVKKRKEFELKIKKEFLLKKRKLIDQLDKDNNGIIDIVENDVFMKLFRKHQSVIKDFDKSYINYLVKISNYLKIKRENIQKIFLEIKKSKDQKNFNENFGLLKNQIHTFEILLFHSLNMIISIVEDDLITFNEIYEEFDKLKIFKSDHEKEISERLSNIEEGLSSLLHSINIMEMRIVRGLRNLTYVTQDSFSNLKYSLSRELSSINSSINTNNLLTGINSYQLYKINKQTKGLIQ